MPVHGGEKCDECGDEFMPSALRLVDGMRMCELCADEWHDEHYGEWDDEDEDWDDDLDFWEDDDE